MLIKIVLLSLFFVEILLFVLIWLLSLIYCKIVLLIWDFFPLRNVHYGVRIYLNFFFTNLFQILPFLFLLLWKNIPLWWFIKNEFCDSVYKTSFSSFITNINLPHFEVLILLGTLFLPIIVLLIILGKNKILFLRILDWSTIKSFRSLCNHHVNCSFTLLKDWVSIGSNLLCKLRIFFSFWNICSS